MRHFTVMGLQACFEFHRMEAGEELGVAVQQLLDLHAVGFMRAQHRRFTTENRQLMPVRSAQACVKMDKLSFTNLVNLDPGFKGWEKAGKPVEK